MNWKIMFGVIGIFALLNIIGNAITPPSRVADSQFVVTPTPTTILPTLTNTPVPTQTPAPTPMPKQFNSAEQGESLVACVLDNVTFQLPKSECEKDKSIGATAAQKQQQLQQQIDSYSVPTFAPVSTPTNTPSELSNDNYYTNTNGVQVHSPANSTDGSVPAGATAQCSDGTYSFSLSSRGTCSHHGGVAKWL